MRYKLHLQSLKMAYYKPFFEQKEKCVLCKNPFNIYWFCKLFDDCRPTEDENITQRWALKKVSNNFLFYGWLNQINDVQPHRHCCCFHCKIHDDCIQELLERNKMETPGPKEEGLYIDFSSIYFNFCCRKSDIIEIYFN